MVFIEKGHKTKVIDFFMATSEVYSKPTQTSKMQLFVKMVNGFQLKLFSVDYFRETPILEVSLGCEYAPELFRYIHVSLHIDEIIRLYNLTKIKNTIMISFAVHGKSRVPRMKNN